MKNLKNIIFAFVMGIASFQISYAESVDSQDKYRWELQCGAREKASEIWRGYKCQKQQGRECIYESIKRWEVGNGRIFGKQWSEYEIEVRFAGIGLLCAIRCANQSNPNHTNLTKS